MYTHSMFPARTRTISPRLVRFVSVLLMLSAGWSRDAVAAVDPSAAPPERANMERLFNGVDLNGWDGDPRLWTVRDGVIRGETTPEKIANGNTFLIRKDTVLKDFELRFSFRCSSTNNSGVQYRSKHIVEGNPRNRWVVRGYQHEIRNENKLPNVSGFIYDEGGRRGRICLVGEKAIWEAGTGKKVTGTLIDADQFEALFRLDDWNDVVIVAQGNHLRHYLNGRLTLDFTDSDPDLALSEGILALQLHGGKPMWVEFKDIRASFRSARRRLRRFFPPVPPPTTDCRRTRGGSDCVCPARWFADCD